jgi:chaperonin cofactor prefoldin
MNIAEGQTEKTGTLVGDVAREERRKELQKRIAVLEKKIACEKQFNRQMERWDEVKRMRERMYTR